MSGVRLIVVLASALAVSVAGNALSATAMAVPPTYTVSACSATTSPGTWQQVNGFPAGMSAGNLCGGPVNGPTCPPTCDPDQGALFGEDLLASNAQIPDGVRAGWTFAAPAGTSVVAVSYYGHLFADELDLHAGLFQADGTPIEACILPHVLPAPPPCQIDHRQLGLPGSFGSLNTPGLFFGVRCVLTNANPACVPGTTAHDAQADLYSVRVTLQETGAPVISSVSGPLWGSGVVSGTVPLSFTASDASGIAQVTVKGSGGSVSQSYPCDYTKAQPCPNQPSGSLSVDTTKLGDSPSQSVQLVVANAAGATTIVSSPPVAIDNFGPPAPVALSATATAAKVVQLRWTNPPAPPQPISSAQAQLCQATCLPAVAVTASGVGQLSAPAPGAYTLHLSLVDTHGKTGAPATTTVSVPGACSSGSEPSRPGGHGRTTRQRRLRARIVKRTLRVSVVLAHHAHGRVLIFYDATQRRRRLARGARRARLHRGVAHAAFPLSRAARTATLLVGFRFGAQHAVTRLCPTHASGCARKAGVC